MGGIVHKLLQQESIRAVADNATYSRFADNINCALVRIRLCTETAEAITLYTRPRRREIECLTTIYVFDKDNSFRPTKRFRRFPKRIERKTDRRRTVLKTRVRYPRAHNNNKSGKRKRRHGITHTEPLIKLSV